MSERQRLRDVERAAQDAAPALTRCAFCPDWTYSGTAAEGRTEALRHRLEFHPEIVATRHRAKHNLRRFVQPPLDPEERALIEFERQRRARVNGVRLT